MCKTVWQSCNWKTTFADKIACNTHANENTQYCWMLLSFPGKSFPFLVKTFRYIFSMCVGFLLCFLATSRDFSTCDKCQHLLGLLADKAGPGQALSSMVTFYRRRLLSLSGRQSRKTTKEVCSTSVVQRYHCYLFILFVQLIKDNPKKKKKLGGTWGCKRPVKLFWLVLENTVTH